jgi:hypothetical protein
VLYSGSVDAAGKQWRRVSDVAAASAQSSDGGFRPRGLEACVDLNCSQLLLGSMRRWDRGTGRDRV